MRANGRTNHGALLGALFSVAALALPACGGSQAPAQGQDALDADPPAGQPTQGGPTHAELKQGIDAIKAERYDEAKPLLEKAVEQSPKSSEAHFYLAVARERTGDRAGAEDAYKKSLAIDPGGMEAMTNLSALYLDDPARPDDAIALIKQGLAKAPDSAALHQNLAFAYGLKGDTANASKHFDAALQKGDNAELRLAYGDFLLKQKQPDKAAEQLRKALAQAPDNAAMVGTIAVMLAYSKAFGDCVKGLDRALKLKPDQPDWLVRRGTCRHELKDEPGARADYQAAIKADEKFAAAHYYLGLSHLEDKKIKEGKSELALAAKYGEGSSIGKSALEKLDSLSGKKK
jgi:Tfp pilus assembly protein PilF